MQEITLKEFSEAIASKKPVPGGGGASALVAAIGIALGDMVGEFTVGKKTYADVEDDVKALMVEAQALRESLINLIDEDAEAFEPVSKAYAIPKDHPDRDKIMEECLVEAARVPMEILKASCRAVELMQGFSEKGSRIMVCDAATGAAFLNGAMCGAAANVKVNTKSMKNRDYADSLNKEVDEMLEKYRAMAEDIYMSIYSLY